MELATDEHRVATRNRVLKSAKIVFDDWRAIDCTLRDISETGAKVRVDGVLTLPRTFQILFITENTIRPVKIAWTRHDTVGVVFTGEAKRAPLRKLC